MTTTTASEAYKIALNDPVRRITDKKIIEEAILANISARCYWDYVVVDYATKVLRGRWREAESLILTAKDARLICFYARYVVKNRWVEAEQILVDLADQDYKKGSGEVYLLVLDYYMNLICGYTVTDRDNYGKHFSDKRDRWLEFEHILHFIFSEIKLSGTYYQESYHYYDKQKKYWKLAHEAKKCFDHAKDVIKGRWIEGEEIIKKHEYWWKRYQDEIINNLSPVDVKEQKMQNELESLRARVRELERSLTNHSHDK